MNTPGGAEILIDRLVITGPAVGADRAERLRVLIEMELRHRLRDGVPDGVVGTAALGCGGDPTVTLGGPEQDDAAAAAIAGRILVAVRGSADGGRH